MDTMTGNQGRSPWRQKGRAMGLLLSGLATVAAGGAYWQYAGWRVEQSYDGRVCGLEKDIAGKTPRTLAIAPTEQAVCRQLAAQNADQCPRIAKSAATRCRSLVEDFQVTRPATISPLIGGPDVQDSGVAAFAKAWARDGWRYVDIMLAGGKLAPADMVVYLLETVAGTCLGVGIGNVILTAAHCIPEHTSRLTATCHTGGVTTRASYSCQAQRPASSPDPCDSPAPIDAARDIAKCQLEAAQVRPACFPTGSEAPIWTLPTEPSKQVWITGIGGTIQLAMVSAETSLPWPTDLVNKGFVLAQTKGYIQDGDSGAPVFDTSQSHGRQVLGIQVCQGRKARIVPLYLWKTELMPVN